MIGAVQTHASAPPTSSPAAGTAVQRPASSEPPKNPAPSRDPAPLLGGVAAPKPGREGATGTQGPALGIRSPVKIETMPRDLARNLSAKDDGSIQFATGARVDTRLTTHQQTAEPSTPLKTRAEGLRGRHVDVRG